MRTLCCLQLLALGAPELLEGLELVQLSFLSRHSIKVPKRFNYSQYSAYPINQSYGAPPGELTPRGVELAEALGRYYGAWYEQLTSHRCPTQQRVLAYSNTILRTVQTTESFLHGFSSECSDQLVRTSHLQQKVHRMFTEGESGNVFEQCKWATEQEVLGTIGGNLTLFAQENLFRELHKLEELVTPLKQSACGADKRCESFVDLPPPQWKGGASFNTFDGGLYVASKFSDYFYFKAMAGLPLEERLGLQGAVELFGISNSMHKLFKNNFNSRFAANLLANWLAGLEQVVYGKSVGIPEVQQQADNQLLMYFGHDVQVESMRLLLGLQWQSLGWPLNFNCMGGQLLLKLFKQQGSFFVQLSYVAPSPEQTRGSVPIDFASSKLSESILSIPGCHTTDARLTDVGYMCTYERFKQLVVARLERNTLCMSPEMRSFVESLVDESRNSNSSGFDHSLNSVVITVVALFMAWLCFGKPMATSQSPISTPPSSPISSLSNASPHASPRASPPRPLIAPIGNLNKYPSSSPSQKFRRRHSSYMF